MDDHGGRVEESEVRGGEQRGADIGGRADGQSHTGSTSGTHTTTASTTQTLYEAGDQLVGVPLDELPTLHLAAEDGEAEREGGGEEKEQGEGKTPRPRTSKTRKKRKVSVVGMAISFVAVDPSTHGLLLLILNYQNSQYKVQVYCTPLKYSHSSYY